MASWSRGWPARHPELAGPSIDLTLSFLHDERTRARQFTHLGLPADQTPVLTRSLPILSFRPFLSYRLPTLVRAWINKGVGVGKASRNKRRTRRPGDDRGRGRSTVERVEWSALAWAKRAVAVMEGAKSAHPAWLGLITAALNQYVRMVEHMHQLDGSGELTDTIALLANDSGLETPEWLDRMSTVVDEINRCRDFAGLWSPLLDKLNELAPHGHRYPTHTEAFVISPEMHNVTMAASLTVTPEDLDTADTQLDPPTPAGVLYLPSPVSPATVESTTRRYAPVSALSWRQHSGHIIAGGPRRHGVFLQAWAARRSLEGDLVWTETVRLSRTAGVAAPVALPVSQDMLYNQTALTELEREQWSAGTRMADRLTTDIPEFAVYDPAEHAPFRLAAYLFAFWRLCAQRTSTTIRPDGSPIQPGRNQEPQEQQDTLGSLDRVRVVKLRSTGLGGPVGSERHYHHRFPVRIHKVRTTAPSRGGQSRSACSVISSAKSSEASTAWSPTSTSSTGRTCAPSCSAWVSTPPTSTPPTQPTRRPSNPVDASSHWPIPRRPAGV
jgi:hypothetical protein